ncbi:helix-turn-helix domain-containing protein [Enterocloster bolteae]|uniref:helix-turn-helix domain-containing protein n=1 Tax=Enterocloster bolteae TaxID=208479 RepID=UPI0034A35F6B
MKLNVKDKMIEKKINRNQFAKLVQIGYPAACAIYDGSTTRISFDTLESICRVLNCTPNDIFISDDPKVDKLLAEYNELIKSNKKNGAVC